MSEEGKPIFPRSSESSEAEKEELRRKTKLKLETEEKRFEADKNAFEQKICCSNCQTESFSQAKFCRVCGNNLILPMPIPPPLPTKFPRNNEFSVVYGPPPMMIENEREDDIHTTVYGPPPMEFETVDQDKYPPIMPAYGPPILPIRGKSWTFWIVLGTALGILLLMAAILIITIFAYFSFR